MILILITVLIFVIFLLNNREHFIINKDEWLNYRLGDIIKGYCFNNKEYKYLDNIEKKNPNSIGGLYIKETKKLKNIEERKNNFKILNKIIEKKCKNMILPNKDDIVIHLRIGDIISSEKLKYSYILHFSELKKLLTNNDSKVILVYGSHIKNIDMNKNNEYLENVRKILKQKNINFEENNSDNPDNDFIFMSKSKKFIKSGGGFSKLIANIVKQGGGEILNTVKL